MQELMTTMEESTLIACRCGDSYESHQHYRVGSDCSRCQCPHYGPAHDSVKAGI